MLQAKKNLITVIKSFQLHLSIYISVFVVMPSYILQYVFIRIKIMRLTTELQRIVYVSL